MKKSAILVPVILVLTFTSFTLIPNVLAVEGTVKNTGVSNAGYIRWLPGIYRDSTGRINILYETTAPDFSSRDLMHAYSDDEGNSWSTQKIVTIPDRKRVGKAAVAGLSNDNLIATFAHSWEGSGIRDGTLEYDRASNTWKVNDLPDNDARSHTLNVGSDNGVHIVYRHWASTVRYRKYTVSWSSATDIDSFNYVGVRDLAVATSGSNPDLYAAVVNNYKYGDSSLRLYRREDGTWSHNVWTDKERDEKSYVNKIGTKIVLVNTTEEADKSIEYNIYNRDTSSFNGWNPLKSDNGIDYEAWGLTQGSNGNLHLIYTEKNGTESSLHHIAFDGSKWINDKQLTTPRDGYIQNATIKRQSFFLNRPEILDIAALVGSSPPFTLKYIKYEPQKEPSGFEAFQDQSTDAGDIAPGSTATTQIVDVADSDANSDTLKINRVEIENMGDAQPSDIQKITVKAIDKDGLLVEHTFTSVESFPLIWKPNDLSAVDDGSGRGELDVTLSDSAVDGRTVQTKVTIQGTEGGTSFTQSATDGAAETIKSEHRPTNISPKDGSADVSRMPTLKSSEFAYPDPKRDHIATQWRIVTESRNYDDPVFAREIPSPLTSIPIMHGVLEHATTYYWQVKYQDDQGNWSEWSQATSFTTLAEPHAEFEMDDDRSGAVLLDASDSESSHPEGKVIGYLWDTNGNGTIDAVRETEKLHADWMFAGSYDVTLKVVDDKGGISRVTKSINVTKSGYDKLLEILAEWLGLTDKVQGQAITTNPKQLIGIKEWFFSSWGNLSNIDEWLRKGDGDKYEWVEDIDLRLNPGDVLTVLKKDINPTVMEEIYGEKSNFDEVENYTYMKHILGVIEEGKFVHGAYDRADDTWVSSSAFRVAMPVVESLLDLHPMTTPVGVGEISSLIFGPEVELLVNLFEMAIAVHDLLGPAMDEMQSQAFGEAFTLYLREMPQLAKNQIKLAFDLDDEKKLDEVYGEVTNYFDDLIELYSDKAQRGVGLTDDFREEIRENVKNLIAELIERHEDELIDKKWWKPWSPVELRVYDTSGNVTGVLDGEVKEEIDNSVFFPHDEELVIYEPVEEYRAELIGKEEGDYSLSSSSRVDGETVSFTGSNISIEKNSDHQYTADWQKLSQGEDGVTVKTDSDGDGIYEDEMKVGNAFSGMKAGTNVNKEFNNQGITLVFDEVTSRGFTNVNVLKKPDFNTSSGIHLVGDTYKFDTTASFSGDVEVTLSYDDSRLTSSQEESLKLYKIAETGEAKDVTTVIDTDKNTLTGTTQSFSYFAVGYPEIKFLPSGWDFFSPPGVPLDPDPSTVLGDNIESPTLYYDYSDDSGYTVYPTETTDTQLTWKQGYWINLDQGKDIDIDVSSPSEDLTIEFYSPGWKQIGVPYNFDWSQLGFSSPDDFETDGAGHVRLVSWDPNDGKYLNHYTNTSYILDPWRGYWIKVKQASSSDPATIKVTETSQSAAAAGTKSPLPQSVDPDELDSPPKPPRHDQFGGSLEVIAYPSPAGAEQVTFKVNRPAEVVEELEVEVFNANGSAIWSGEAKGRTLTWNTKGAPNGIYLYRSAVRVDGEWEKLGVAKLLVLK